MHAQKNLCKRCFSWKNHPPNITAKSAEADLNALVQGAITSETIYICERQIHTWRMITSMSALYCVFRFFLRVLRCLYRSRILMMKTIAFMRNAQNQIELAWIPIRSKVTVNPQKHTAMRNIREPGFVTSARIGSMKVVCHFSTARKYVPPIVSTIPRNPQILTYSPKRMILENTVAIVTSHFIGDMSDISPRESDWKLKYFPK